jgi:hypothetical protein
MGSTCCKNNDEETHYGNIDEFYNPYHKFFPNMIYDKKKIERHGPNRGQVID